MSMKSFLRTALNFSMHLWGLLIVAGINLFNRKKIYVFDIDNTLANTWPSLLVGNYENEKVRLESLAVFINMRNFILSRYRIDSVLFISNRSVLQYFTTIKWLKSMEINVTTLNLILVENPKAKLYYLKVLSKHNDVVYIDDLSYGHENGKVSLYSEVICELKGIKMKYFGMDVIDRFNKKHG